MLNTKCYILNNEYLLVGKSAFEFRAAIFDTYKPFFRTLRLALFLAKPYYQKVRIDPGITLGFLVKHYFAL